MCIAVIFVDVIPGIPLLIASNRDEFFERATAPLAPWLTPPGILAGKDLERGGTWLGVTTDGGFTLLTNYREVGHAHEGAPSRGALTADFLHCTRHPTDYLGGLDLEAHNGVNLIVGRVVPPGAAPQGRRPMSELLPAALASNPADHGAVYGALGVPRPQHEEDEYAHLRKRSGSVVLQPPVPGARLNEAPQHTAEQPGGSGSGGAAGGAVAHRRSSMGPAARRGTRSSTESDTAAQAAGLKVELYAVSNRGAASALGVAVGAGGKEGDAKVKQVQGPPGSSYCLELERGVFAVSNGPMGAPWPKVERIRGLAREAVLGEGASSCSGEELFARIFEKVLWDTEICSDDGKLPDTGLPLDLERSLSSICIEPFLLNNNVYGTRASTILAYSSDGSATIAERWRTEYLPAEWNESVYQFDIAPRFPMFGLDNAGAAVNFTRMAREAKQAEQAAQAVATAAAAKRRASQHLPGETAGPGPSGGGQVVGAGHEARSADGPAGSADAEASGRGRSEAAAGAADQADRVAAGLEGLSLAALAEGLAAASASVAVAADREVGAESERAAGPGSSGSDQ